MYRRKNAIFQNFEYQSAAKVPLVAGTYPVGNIKPFFMGKFVTCDAQEDPKTTATSRLLENMYY